MVHSDRPNHPYLNPTVGVVLSGTQPISVSLTDSQKTDDPPKNGSAVAPFSVARGVARDRMRDFVVLNPRGNLEARPHTNHVSIACEPRSQ